MSSIHLNTDFLNKCASEYDNELNPYIFDSIDFLRSEYQDPISVSSEDDLIQVFTKLANRLRRIHILSEALRVNKEPDYTRGRNFRFDLDEIAMIIHAFIPIVQLSMTENTKKFELAVYQSVGSYKGTYQFDKYLIEQLIFMFSKN